jgi:hypothetical protein
VVGVALATSPLGPCAIVASPVVDITGRGTAVRTLDLSDANAPILDPARS